MNTPPPVPASIEPTPPIGAASGIPQPVSPPARPPRPWLGFVLDFLMAMGLLLATTLVGMIVWGIVRAMQVVATRGPELAADGAAFTRAIGEPGAVPLLVVGSLAMLAAAALVYRWRRRASNEEIAHSRAAAMQPRTWLEAIGLGFGLFVASTALMMLLERFGHAPEPSNLQMLEQALAFSPLLLIFVAVLMAPLSEELLFRRVLFGRLWAAGKPMAGLVASSLLFALMHEIPGTTSAPWPMNLVLLLFYALMGASFAWIYRRRGTLWAAILAHATNNLLTCAMLRAGIGS